MLGTFGQPGENMFVRVVGILDDGLDFVGGVAVVGFLEEGGDAYIEGSAGVEARSRRLVFPLMC